MNILLLLAAVVFQPQVRPAQKPQAPQPPPAAYAATHSMDQMQGKQAVIETTAGPIVLDLLPDAAPNHVSYFLKLAAEGAYKGTTFHRAIKYGIIQGGDPLSRDPAKRELYGTGGLGVLKAEAGAGRHVKGAVSSVILPGRPDTGGAQFFICVVDQPALDGQYTVFARVVEGMNTVTKISEAAVDEKGRVTDRIEITAVTIRDKPAPPPTFANETPAELGSHRVMLETTAGHITLEFRADKAPEHVRNFLRLAAAGVFDGTAFHRVVRGFVIQGGSMNYRREPLEEGQRALIHNLQPEFNDIPHVLGTLSMARGDDPASATSSFFICTGPAGALDGKYTAFGKVAEGLDVVQAIEAMPVDGETPKTRVEVTRARVLK